MFYLLFVAKWLEFVLWRHAKRIKKNIKIMLFLWSQRTQTYALINYIYCNRRRQWQEFAKWREVKDYYCLCEEHFLDEEIYKRHPRPLLKKNSVPRYLKKSGLEENISNTQSPLLSPEFRSPTCPEPQLTTLPEPSTSLRSKINRIQMKKN
ncbi:hypothetical protein ABEB36_011043 [Hypothenemus hampei]|uniref:THAP-type domain-containing protein n=1 Tax=Hypothenemus hampei TaxID=57062 RepID=A0ABD1EI83_HYPHA